MKLEKINCNVFGCDGCGYSQTSKNYSLLMLKNNTQISLCKNCTELLISKVEDYKKNLKNN